MTRRRHDPNRSPKRKPTPAPTPGGAFHADSSVPVALRRRDHAAALVGMIEEARAAGNLGIVPALTKQLADLTGLNAPPPPPRIRVRPEPADALDGLRLRLADTQQLRVRASREGSFVAARDLLRLEGELVTAIAAEVASRAPKREAMTDEQIISEVAADLIAMPPAMRRAVLALVAEGDAPARGRAAN